MNLQDTWIDAVDKVHQYAPTVIPIAFGALVIWGVVTMMKKLHQHEAEDSRWHRDWYILLYASCAAGAVFAIVQIQKPPLPCEKLYLDPAQCTSTYFDKALPPEHSTDQNQPRPGVKL